MSAMKKALFPILLPSLLLAGCQTGGSSYSYSEKEDPSLVYFSTLKQAIKNELSKENLGFSSSDFGGEALFISQGKLLKKETAVTLKAKEAKLQINHMNGTLEELDGLYEVNNLNFFMNGNRMMNHSASVGAYVDDSIFYYDVSGAVDFVQESGESFKAIFQEVLGEENIPDVDWSFLDDWGLDLPEKGKVVGDSGSQLGAMIALSPFLLKMASPNLIDSLKDDYDSNRGAYSLSHRNGTYSMEISPNQEAELETMITIAIDAYLSQQGGSLEIDGVSYSQKEVDDFLKQAFSWVDVDEFWLRLAYQENGFSSFSFNFTLGFDENLLKNETLGLVTHLHSLKIAGSFEALKEADSGISFPSFSDFKEVQFTLPEGILPNTEGSEN